MSAAPRFDYIQVDLTNNCNLNCVHYRNALRKCSEEIDSDILLSFLSFVKENYGLNAVTFSGGEPFLYENLGVLLKKTQKLSLETRITSNGYDWIKIEKNLPYVNAIQISIDGNETLHNSIRRNPNAYKKSIDTISKLLNKGIKTSVRITVTRNNIKEIISTVEFLSSTFPTLSEISLREIIPMSSEMLLQVPDFVEYMNLMKFLFNDYKGAVRVVSADPKTALVRPKLLKELDKFKEKNKNVICGCVLGYCSFFINVNGDVMPCSYLETPIGNIYKTDFKDIIESTYFRKIRQYRHALKGKCSLCELKNYCGGCRAVTYNLKADLFESDDTCLKDLL